MIPTLSFIEETFDKFNSRIFRGRLPRIKFELSDAKTFRGLCQSRIIVDSYGKKQHTDFTIRISRCYNLPPEEWEDVVIHEMIHYFIGYNGLIDSSPHGHIFKSLMTSINSEFGRKIGISHRTSPEEKVNSEVAIKKWHVIAVIKLRNGKTGIKVIPRTMNSIIKFYNDIVRQSQVKNIELYLHNNPFFNSYPVSTALRLYHVEPTVIEKNLSGAELLIVENGKVIQTGKSHK